MNLLSLIVYFDSPAISSGSIRVVRRYVLRLRLGARIISFLTSIETAHFQLQRHFCRAASFHVSVTDGGQLALEVYPFGEVEDGGSVIHAKKWPVCYHDLPMIAYLETQRWSAFQ